MKPYIANDVKFNNRKAVYNYIHKKAIFSRTDIANELKISPPTVMKIMNFFESRNIVLQVNDDYVQNSVGRKAQQYKFNNELCFNVGIVFEGEYLKLGIVDLAGDIVHFTNVKINFLDIENINVVLTDSIKKLLHNANVTTEKVVGIGVGIPGVYDDINNIIVMAPLIGINEPTNVQFVINHLVDTFNVPVFIGNDVNMEVLGEYYLLGLDREDMLYISLGTGIGAGIVLDGKLRVGNMFNAGEIGYMAFSDDYVSNKSSVGWLENRINIKALQTRFGGDIFSQDDKDTHSNKIDEIIEYIATTVAICINNIVAILDLKNVVIGGIISEYLGVKLNEAVEKNLKEKSVFDVTINSRVSQNSGIVGTTIKLSKDYVAQMLADDIE